MESGETKVQPSANRPLALLGVAVAAVITLIAVYLFVALPSLIPRGGIPTAQSDFQTLSPTFFPRLTFALLAGLGLTYFISNVRALSAAHGGTFFKEAGTLSRVVTLLVIAVTYPFLLIWFGFLGPTILLMAAMTILLGIRVWWQVLGFAFVTPIAIRFIFERLLAIALPSSDIEWISRAEEDLMRLLASIFL